MYEDINMDQPEPDCQTPNEKRIQVLEAAIAEVLFDYDTTGKFLLQHREKLATAVNDESHK